MPFKLLSCVTLHLLSGRRRDSIACADDGTIEGEGTLAEEKMGEGEGRRLLGRRRLGDARTGSCVASEEEDTEAHVGVGSPDVGRA